MSVVPFDYDSRLFILHQFDICYDYCYLLFRLFCVLSGECSPSMFMLMPILFAKRHAFERMDANNVNHK